MFYAHHKKPRLTAGYLFHLVNRVQSNWNILVEDFYRVRGIISILYPTNYIPGLSRTNEYTTQSISNPSEQ